MEPRDDLRTPNASHPRGAFEVSQWRVARDECAHVDDDRGRVMCRRSNLVGAALLLLAACAEADKADAPAAVVATPRVLLAPTIANMPMRRAGAAYELGGPQYVLGPAPARARATIDRTILQSPLPPPPWFGARDDE